MKFIPIRYISNLSVVGHGILDRELDPDKVLVTGDKTLTKDDEFIVVASNATLTLPSTTDCVGMLMVIKNKDVVTVINAAAGEYIDNETTITIYEWEAITLYSDGDGTWLIV